MKRARSPEVGRDNVHSDSEDSDSEAYTLDELGELYESADAVLGASDPDNCSWTKGYVKRQAIYACVTCNGPNPTKQQAGICLACSNKCHEHHQLIELYTKRNFRCDCGNTKFQTPCLLQPEKDALNDGNLYNQNFDGVYCTCKRPYPDPDDLDSNDEMAQCVICEDWFHGKHSFGQDWSSIAAVDGNDSDYEMVCASCITSCDFLHHYGHLTLKLTIPEEENKELSTEGDEKMQVVENSPSSGGSGMEDEKTSTLKAEIDVESRSGPSGGSPTTFCSSAPVTDEALSGSASQETVDSGIMSDGSQEKSSDKQSDNGKDCLLKSLPKKLFPKGAILLESGWRTKICRCESCLNLYYKLGVSFVIDENDTLRAYEAIGKEKIEEEEKQKEEAFTNMWSKLDHVAQIEAMIGINEMKEQLREFMLKHDGKVIKRRDVEAFFSDLRAKRPRYGSGDGIPPSNCR